MIDKVRAAISEYKMLGPGERVTVALSGGADSVALLNCLIELDYDVFAVHVNHHLRGEESERDAEFCRELCLEKGVEIFVEDVDVRGYCEKNKCSTELGARELRYSALRKHCGGSKIATAHTLSDALETAIFNLTRGCGLKGLSSIPPVRGDIVRPLINCSREEIEEYLRQKGESYVTDSTNLEPDCSRNIIRLRVVPELKKINPGLTRSFYGTVNSLRECDRFIDSEAEKIPADADFSEYGGAAASRKIQKLLSENGVEPSFERISSVKNLIKTGGRINLKKGVYLRSAGGRLTFECGGEYAPICFETDRLSFETAEKKASVTKISPFDISLFNKDELRYMFDEAKLPKRLTVRNCRGSEKIRLPERGMSQEVKKLLSGDSPLERRKRIVIDDGGGAVFVETVGVSERVCCDNSTVSALKIEIKDV